MTDLTEIKAQARKAAFARRKQAFDTRPPGAAGHLSEVLAGYRGVPLAGYMPIRTEINPLPAMAEAAAHGDVSVPVIQGEGLPLEVQPLDPGRRTARRSLRGQGSGGGRLLRARDPDCSFGRL